MFYDAATSDAEVKTDTTQLYQTTKRFAGFKRTLRGSTRPPDVLWTSKGLPEALQGRLTFCGSQNAHTEDPQDGDILSRSQNVFLEAL